MDGFVYILCCYKLPACPGTVMRSISHHLHPSTPVLLCFKSPSSILSSHDGWVLFGAILEGMVSGL